MKIEPFLVASTVNVIVAQRLVRKICEVCKIPIQIKTSELLKNVPQSSLEKIFDGKEEISIFKGVGCKTCHMTQYEGRIGVFEILEVTPGIKKLITEKQDSDVIIREAVAEGMTTMLEDGLMKVAKGITTIEEVLRVTKVEVL